MGLDVIAARRVARIGDLNDPALEDRWRSTVRLYPEPSFTARADGLEPGVYERADHMGFRAGSYRSYNYYRDQLARFAFNVPAEAVWRDRERYEGKPFYEQIDFSDCEGVIGPATSAKLARDYADWDEGARKEWGTDSEQYRLYTLWRRAFEMAADAGAVQYA